MRRASSGRIISMVSAVWGVMMRRGSAQSRWPSGSGSGSVTSRPAPARLPAARASARASVWTWRPRATLTRWARRSIRPSSAAPMMPMVSGVNAKARKTTRAPGSTECSAALGTVRTAPGTGRGGAGRRWPAPGWGEESEQLLGHATATEDGDVLVVEARSRRPPPAARRDPLGEEAEQRLGEQQGVLGDGFGVRTFGTGPRPRRVEEAGGRHRLDPGVGQLHPAHVRLVGQDGAAARRGGRRGARRSSACSATSTGAPPPCGRRPRPSPGWRRGTRRRPGRGRLQCGRSPWSGCYERDRGRVDFPVRAGTARPGGAGSRGD